MSDIQLQERQLLDNLQPIFRQEGYQLLPAKKQFRHPTRNGFRSVVISVQGNQQEQIIDLQLGLRLNLIEELVQQFINDTSAYTPDDSTTLLTSVYQLNQSSRRRFLLKSPADVDSISPKIEQFMQKRGFNFLERIDKLKRVDALINRKPQQPNLYLPNQISRCFKGLALARFTYRTNYNFLVKTYLAQLQEQWAPHSVIANFKRFARFLRYYSLN